MAVRDKKNNTGFLISSDRRLDLSVLNKAVKKTLHAIRSILSLGWIPSSEVVDPDNFDVDKAREAEMTKQGNIGNITHLYSRRY